jgi:hypothetical protein
MKEVWTIVAEEDMAGNNGEFVAQKILFGYYYKNHARRAENSHRLRLFKRLLPFLLF